MRSIRGSSRRDADDTDGEASRPRTTLHEAAHKTALVDPDAGGQGTAKAPSFNEAAHKLEDWSAFRGEQQKDRLKGTSRSGGRATRATADAPLAGCLIAVGREL